MACRCSGWGGGDACPAAPLGCADLHSRHALASACCEPQANPHPTATQPVHASRLTLPGKHLPAIPTCGSGLRPPAVPTRHLLLQLYPHVPRAFLVRHAPPAVASLAYFHFQPARAERSKGLRGGASPLLLPPPRRPPPGSSSSSSSRACALVEARPTGDSQLNQWLPSEDVLQVGGQGQGAVAARQGAVLTWPWCLTMANWAFDPDPAAAPGRVGAAGLAMVVMWQAGHSIPSGRVGATTQPTPPPCCACLCVPCMQRSEFLLPLADAATRELYSQLLQGGRSAGGSSQLLQGG